MASPGKRRRKKRGGSAPTIIEVVEEAPKVVAPKPKTKPKIKPKRRKGFFDKD